MSHVSLIKLRRESPRHSAPSRYSLPQGRRSTHFPQRVKLAARTRAGDGDPYMARCEWCHVWLGRDGGEVRRRVADGSTYPVLTSVANAVLLCGNRNEGCSRKAARREFEAEAGGWFIRGGEGPEHDPRRVPVLVSLDGSTVFRWLSEDGRYAAQAPAGG